MRKLLISILVLVSLTCTAQINQQFAAYADNLDSLYTHVGKQGLPVWVKGRFSANDGFAGLYFYDSTSTATEIPYLCFHVTGRSTGRWNYVQLLSTGGGDSTVFNNPDYAVLDILTIPPTSPNDQDKYLAGVGSAGAWSGQDNDIQTWNTSGTHWTQNVPTIGQLLTNGANDHVYKFTATGWVDVTTSLVFHQNGDNYGPINQYIGNKKNKGFGVKTNNTLRFFITAAGYPEFYYLQNGTVGDSLLSINNNRVKKVAYPATGGASAFLGLSDVPNSYSGQGLKLVRVNSGATGLEFFTSNYLTGNQSISWTASGDVSGSASGTTSLSPSLTITGLRGTALPSLSAGLLKYTGSAWVFDNNTYLTSYAETDPLSVHISDSAAMLAHYTTQGVISWPGTLYTTPTVASFSGHTLTYSPTLASQSAWYVLGNHTSSPAAPTFGKIDVHSMNATGSSYDGSKALYDDGTWKAPGGGGGLTISNVVNYTGAGLINPSKDSLYRLYGTIGNYFDTTTNSKGATLNIKGAPLADSTNQPRIQRFFGASVTASGWPALVARSTNSTGVVRAQTGTTFLQYSVGDSSFINKYPTIPNYTTGATIFIGGDYILNELINNHDFQTWKDTLAARVDSLNQKKGYPYGSIVLMTSNPMGVHASGKNDDSLTRWNNYIKTLAASRQTALVDVHTYMVNNTNKNLLQSDSLHPTLANGQWNIYQAIVNTLYGGIRTTSSLFLDGGGLHIGKNVTTSGVLDWGTLSGSGSVAYIRFFNNGSIVGGDYYSTVTGAVIHTGRGGTDILFSNSDSAATNTTAAFGASNNKFFANAIGSYLPFNGLTGNQIVGVGTNLCGIGYNGSTGYYPMWGRALDGGLMFGVGNDATAMTLSNCSYYLKSGGEPFFNKKLFFDGTNTTTGTTGAQTINKPSGKVNFAAAATSLVVTNSLVTTSSIVIVTVEGTDATFTSARVTLASGSFTITANAAATAETKVDFLVIN